MDRTQQTEPGTSSLMRRVRDEIEPGSLRRDREYARVLRRVGAGQQLSGCDWSTVGRDFLFFSEEFPKALAGLIDRVDMAQAPEAQRWLQDILDEELGQGPQPDTPHSQLLEQFLVAVGVTVGQVPSAAASQLLGGLKSLYSDRQSSIPTALGAQTAFEVLAEEIIINFNTIATVGGDCDRGALAYFHVHLTAETEHVRAMEHVAAIFQASPTDADAFVYGAGKASSLIKAFWTQLWTPVLDPSQEATIFLSWSGTAAQRSAKELRDTLTQELGASERPYFFFSDTDVASGANWEQIIREAAASASAGVIVLTPESAASPWVNFEAGLLSNVSLSGRPPGPDALHSLGGSNGFPLHVLVVSSDSRGLVQHHPLESLQLATSQNPDKLIEAIWALLADHHSHVDQPTVERVAAVGEDLRDRLRPWEYEADRAAARQESVRAAWAEYLLSLTGPRLSVPSPDPTRTLPADLHDADDLLHILESLVVSHFGSQIEHGDRVYFAVRVNDDIVYRANKAGPIYRFLYVAGGRFDELNWLENALVGPHSTLHRAYAGRKRLLAEDSDELNAPVPEEAVVGCAPICLGSKALGVLGLSSSEDARTLRVEEELSKFTAVLEYFFNVVAARVRRGDLVLDDAASPTAVGTDEEIAAGICAVLAEHRRSELFVDESSILNLDLLVQNSFR